MYYIFRNDNERVYTGDGVTHSFSPNPFNRTLLTLENARMIMSDLLEIGYDVEIVYNA